MTVKLRGSGSKQNKVSRFVKLARLTNFALRAALDDRLQYSILIYHHWSACSFYLQSVYAASVALRSFMVVLVVFLRSCFLQNLAQCMISLVISNVDCWLMNYEEFLCLRKSRSSIYIKCSYLCYVYPHISFSIYKSSLPGIDVYTIFEYFYAIITDIAKSNRLRHISRPGLAPKIYQRLDYYTDKDINSATYGELQG